MNLKYKTKFLSTVCLCMIVFFNFAQTPKFKVTLDAGHGGKDFGANYHGHVEKNIALAVVLKVGKFLESKSDIDVNYTRKTDVFIDLVERANIANRVDANIFVSIHCNANKNTAAHGTETYVMGLAKSASSLSVSRRENSVITLEKDYKQNYKGFDPNSPESMIGNTVMQEEFLENSISLASRIQDKFASDLNKTNRGVKQDVFMVLHKASMPRVLVEIGFISNPEEGEALDSEDGQNDIAQAIANAILSYKREYFDGGEFDNEKPNIEKPKSDPVKNDSPKIIKESQKLSIEPVKKDIKTENLNGIIYKIQLSASSKKLELSPNNFKGLKNISMTSEGKIYKYMAGNTSDYDEIKKQLQEAKTKGYESAFVIAFKNGKKINVSEALKN